MVIIFSPSRSRSSLEGSKLSLEDAVEARGVAGFLEMVVEVAEIRLMCSTALRECARSSRVDLELPIVALAALSLELVLLREDSRMGCRLPELVFETARTETDVTSSRGEFGCCWRPW